MKIKEITSGDLACLIAIIIGGVYSIVNPSFSDDIFLKTIVAVVLIKLFW
jgi:drug/metabolite transporter (DMT)-like permease